MASFLVRYLGFGNAAIDDIVLPRSHSAILFLLSIFCRAIATVILIYFILLQGPPSGCVPAPGGAWADDAGAAGVCRWKSQVDVC